MSRKAWNAAKQRQSSKAIGRSRAVKSLLVTERIEAGIGVVQRVNVALANMHDLVTINRYSNNRLCAAANRVNS